MNPGGGGTAVKSIFPSTRLYNLVCKNGPMLLHDEKKQCSAFIYEPSCL